jgi:chaperonin GroES
MTGLWSNELSSRSSCRIGLYIRDRAKEKPQEDEVAVGKGKRLEDGKVVPLDLQVSDRILFGRMAMSS